MRRTGLGILALGLAVILTAAAVGAQVPVPLALESKVPRGTAPEARTAPGFPLLFVENRGRYEDGVRFFVEHEDGVILVRDGTIVFREHGREDLVLTFPECNPAAIWRSEWRARTVVHYLIGKEAAWRTDVPTFHRLRCANLWPGIDMVLRGEPGAVKYDFHLSPCADPSQIKMRYPGARLSIEEVGTLTVRDPKGVRRTDPASVAFQSAREHEELVTVGFSLDRKSGDTVGFSVKPYDRSRPLVIDPAFLACCGYLPPGMGPYHMAVDANGAAVVVGMYFRSISDYDACIVRIRPDGTGFDFVTYLGGKKNDLAMGVAVDASGIYIGGHTSSDEQSFPVKVGPDLTFNNRGQINLDSFVCKLALDGKKILYCGYIGGSKDDGIRESAVAVDATGALWLAGQTTSTDYPVVGGPQITMPGPEPACVTKVAPDGRSLVFSGYIGGSSPWAHYCMGVAVDARGDGYVTGVTTSDEKQYAFPVKAGPQLQYGGGSADTFLAKIDGQTGRFVYCGFIGGADFDQPWSVAVDAQGAAYVTGQTFSSETTFPVVGGPLTRYMPSYNRGDGFLTKVKPAGTGFVYSGYLGGAVGQGIAVDAAERCYLGGNMPPITPPFPVGGALAPANAGGLDGFVTRISADGRVFEYAGFLGGTADDSISALALGPRGTVHVTGVTASQNTFPLWIGPDFNYNPAPTPGAYGTFVAKIADVSIVPSGTGKLGTAVTFTLSANDDAGLAYQAGTSLTAGPTPLGSRTLGLGLDAVLAVSVSNGLPLTFQDYAGFIGANATATATVHIPNVPMLVGQFFYTAFITLDPKYPLGIKSISDTASFQVTP
jgi:hypothetical protein